MHLLLGKRRVEITEEVAEVHGYGVVAKAVDDEYTEEEPSLPTLAEVKSWV